MEAPRSRPNGAKCDSPGQRPGSSRVQNNLSPEGAERFKVPIPPLKGGKSYSTCNPGRCPGLSHCAPLGLKELWCTS